MGTRIAVVDRQLTVADLLAARLHAQPDVDHVTAHTRVDPLLLVSGAVDAVILDWRLCEGDAGVIVELVATNPSVRVLIIGNGATPSDFVVCVEAGAAGWLPSDVSFGELLTGLHTSLRGEFWVPGRVALWALHSRPGTSTATGSLSPLTPREREVLQGMVDGLTREEIARRLGMSPHTVRTHVHAVLHKLGVHSSLRAVAVARQAGLVTTPQDLPRQRLQGSSASRWTGQ